MLKRKIVPLIVGGALLVGGVSAGTAYASSATTTPSGSVSPSGSAPTGSTPTASASAPTDTLHLRVWLRAHRHQLRREAVTVSAKAIGVTPTVLVSELRSGKSIAEVAAEHSVSVQTVTDALASAATARINHAVSAGKLTTAQAQTIESHLAPYLTRVVDRVH